MGLLPVALLAGFVANALAAVTVTPLRADPDFPDAAAADALSLACAPSDQELAAFFRGREIPFEPALIRSSKSRLCHLYYEPSVRGFRALPDNAPISEIFLDLLLPGFLSLRSGATATPWISRGKCCR
jgi:hypothetical protein